MNIQGTDIGTQLHCRYNLDIFTALLGWLYTSNCIVVCDCNYRKTKPFTYLRYFFWTQ